MKTVLDNIMVHVDAEVLDRDKSGLYIVSGYEPTGPPKDKQTKGVVTGLPVGYYEFTDIIPDIQVGDTVYFHFNAISPDSRLLTEYSQSYDHSIPLSMIFCAVRDGEIIMIGGRVLCEKYYDPDITFEEVNGAIIPVKKSKLGFITEMNVKHNEHKAVLRHIGKPLKGQKLPDVKPGDIVYYEKDSDFENTIEGREFLCMRYENLIMKEI